MYAQDSILCQFGPRNLSSVQQLISQPILIHFWWELYHWKRLKHIAKNQKQLTRAINQSKIRQVRRSAVYQFGFLIPKDYKQALQLDEQNGNSKWYDATKLEMDQINEY